jgi:hypothetical protein
MASWPRLDFDSSARFFPGRLAHCCNHFAPEGLPSKNLIVLDLDNHDSSGTLTEDWLPLSLLSSHSRPDSFPRISGRSASSQQGQNIMKTLFYILRKDGNGTLRWVEAVNDVDTAEARATCSSCDSAHSCSTTS